MGRRIVRGVIAGMVSAMLFEGCTIVRDNPFQVDRIIAADDSDGRMKKMRKKFGVAAINLETFEFEDIRSGDSAKRSQGPSASSAYKRAVEDESGLVRNRLQSRLMFVSDRICDDHKAEVLGFRAQSNLLLSLITTATGTAGALVSMGAANALSAAAAATNATRSAINDEIYQRLLVPAILRSVDQKRREKEQDIMARRERDGKPTAPAVYTVDEAIRDAVNYHELCSFYQGVVALTKGTERTLPGRAELRQQADDLRKRIQGYQEDLKQVAASSESEDAKKARRTSIERTLQALQSELETLERLAGSLGDPGTVK